METLEYDCTCEKLQEMTVLIAACNYHSAAGDVECLENRGWNIAVNYSMQVDGR